MNGEKAISEQPSPMLKKESLGQSANRGALKLAETAIFLSVSKPTVHRLVKRGLLKPNRATRHLLFPIAELERFLRS